VQTPRRSKKDGVNRRSARLPSPKGSLAKAESDECLTRAAGAASPRSTRPRNPRTGVRSWKAFRWVEGGGGAGGAEQGTRSYWIIPAAEPDSSAIIYANTIRDSVYEDQVASATSNATKRFSFLKTPADKKKRRDS